MKRTTWEAGRTAYGSTGRIGDDDAGQSVFGHHVRCVKRAGVDGYDRKFFDDVLCVHVVAFRGRLQPIADQTSRHT